MKHQPLKDGDRVSFKQGELRLHGVVQDHMELPDADGETRIPVARVKNRTNPSSIICGQNPPVRWFKRSELRKIPARNP